MTYYQNGEINDFDSKDHESEKNQLYRTMRPQFDGNTLTPKTILDDSMRDVKSQKLTY